LTRKNTTIINKEIQNLDYKPKNYKIYAGKVRKISRQHIIRCGCGDNYISSVRRSIGGNTRLHSDITHLATTITESRMML